MAWETLTKLIPQFVAGEHSLFGGHESEDIQTIFNKKNLKLQIFSHIYKYNPERGVRWLQFSQVPPSLLIFNEFSKYLDTI